MEDCRACQSDNRGFIDEELAKPANDRLGFKVISSYLAELGETVSPSELVTHRAHIISQKPKVEKVATPPSRELEATIDELKAEASKVPATLSAPYFVLIHFLENLGSQEVKPADAIRAAVAITQIAGRQTEQQMLLSFAERAFGPEGAFSTEDAPVDATQSLASQGAFTPGETAQGDGELGSPERVEPVRG